MVCDWFSLTPLYHADPEEDFNAGIGHVEMLGRTNYVALVGGGRQPKFPQNKVSKDLLSNPWLYVDRPR